MTDEAIPAARNGENAALLATLLMIKAQALEGQGRVKDARAVRLDALGWGRYGFGSGAVGRDKRTHSKTRIKR